MDTKQLVSDIRKALDKERWTIHHNAPTWLEQLCTLVESQDEDLKELNEKYGALEYANIDNVMELEQLRELVESLKGDITYWFKQWEAERDLCRDQKDHLRAENTRLQAERDKAVEALEQIVYEYDQGLGRDIQKVCRAMYREARNTLSSLKEGQNEHT